MCYIYWKGPSLESGKFEFRIQIGFLLLLTSAKLATFSQLLYPSMWNFAEGLCVLKEKTDVGCLVQYPWSLWISGRHFSTGVLLPCLSQIYKQDASLHALYLLNSTNILFLFLRIPIMKWYEKKNGMVYELWVRTTNHVCPWMGHLICLEFHFSIKCGNWKSSQSFLPAPTCLWSYDSNVQER